MIRCRWPRGMVVAVCPILWRNVAPADVNRTMTGLRTVSPSLKFVNCGPEGGTASFVDAASTDPVPITAITTTAAIFADVHAVQPERLTSILTQTDGRRKA